jgi:hypothetical protein
VPVIRRSLLAFLRHRVGAVQAVIHPEDRELYEAPPRASTAAAGEGGGDPEASVAAGLDALAGARARSC